MENSVPRSMRAWIHLRAGQPATVLSLSSDMPTPTIKAPNDVLVRISHAALNPGASIIMQLCPFFFRSKPAIPELDFSGTLIAAGPAALESGRIAIGDSVFGSIGAGQHTKAGSGALAEYVVVPAANVARKPTGKASDAEASGIGVAGCTAVALVEKAALQSGDSVLVNGASGGIGSMVVQMAKCAVGANGRVVAVCSGTNASLVQELGADEVVDYKACHPVSQHLATQYSDQRFSAVIDAYGVREIYSHCGEYLLPGKPFVTVGVAHKHYTYSSIFHAVIMMAVNILSSLLPGNKKRRYVQVNSAVNAEAMENLRSMVEQGRLRVPVDSCWHMKDALQAYDRILSRRARGKVVVKVEEG